MHYNVSCSQHQISCSVYVIHKPKNSGLVVSHKPKDSGLVVQCFLRKNNGSEGKEMVKRGEAMNTALGFVPSVMIRVFFQFSFNVIFFIIYVLCLFIVNPRSDFRCFNALVQNTHTMHMKDAWLCTNITDQTLIFSLLTMYSGTSVHEQIFRKKKSQVTNGVSSNKHSSRQQLLATSWEYRRKSIGCCVTFTQYT
jgi:hypothetical protein